MVRTGSIPGKSWCTPLAVLSMVTALTAQELGPTARQFCEPQEPPCARRECDCFDGRLQVELDAAGGSVLEVARFDPGEAVEMTVALETPIQDTPPHPGRTVQGWTFGMKHDPRLLTLESVTMEGSDAQKLAPCAFLYLSMEQIQECPADDPACSSPVPGSGYVAAFVIISDGPSIPPGRSSLHRALYRLTGEEAGPQGTLIEFTGRLKRGSSPPVDIYTTVGGRALRPRFLIDGLIRSAGPDPAFHRGDPTADGRVTVGDAIATLLFLFRGAGVPPCLEAADFDDDGRLQVTDAVAILQWLFLDAAVPSSPGPPGMPCGPDPPTSPGRMGCAEYPGC